MVDGVVVDGVMVGTSAGIPPNRNRAHYHPIAIKTFPDKGCFTSVYA